MSSIPTNHRLKIPDPHKDGLKSLIELGASDKKALLEALRTTPSALNPALLVSAIQPKVHISGGKLDEIIRMLISLLLTRSKFELPIEQISADVTAGATAEGLGGLSAESKDVAVFQNYLAELLGLDVPLGITAKAINVLTQHEHPFSTARILSDIRPIFASGNDVKPLAGIIVHNLQIHMFRPNIPNVEEESLIIAMDERDLRTLQAVIERAIQKEEALKNVITTSGLNYIPVASL